MKHFLKFAVIGIVVVSIATGGYLWLAARSVAAETTSNTPTATVLRGPLVVSVNTSGNISPVQQLNLNFGQPGTVQVVTITVGSSVKAGQVLAQLDTTQFKLALQNVQASLKTTQDKLAQDQHPSTLQEIAGAQAAAAAAAADYQNMIAPPTEADLTSAEQGVASAQAVYNAAISTASTGNDSLNAAAGAVQAAQAAMQQAQAAYDKVASQPNIAMLSQSLTLQQTSVAYQQAVADYQSLETTTPSGNTSTIQQAQAQIATAMDSLAKIEKPNTPQQILAANDLAAEAQDTLQNMLVGSTSETLDEDQNAVTQAQVALQQAQLAVQQTQIVAPFAGVVTAVNITPGQDTFTTELTPDIQVANLSHLQLVVNMAETDVVNARPGQAAQIQLDALPNVAITGTVTLVSPYGTLTQGVVNYPVTIVLNNPPLGVDAGMSANINIITHQVSNALYVPNRAVEAGAWGLATTSAAPSATPAGTGKAAASGGTKPATRLQYVTVLTDGKQSQTAVQTGLSNNSMTQIVSGLTEGEIVLLNLPTTIAQQPKTTSSGSLGLPGVGRIPG